MIPEHDYTVTGYVGSDIYNTAIRACDSLAHNYDGTDELNTLVGDVADRVIPIFRDELIKVIWPLEFYIGQALDEGLVRTDPREFSMLRLIQSGYYEFLAETLSKNLDAIVFNNLVQAINADDSNEPYEEEIEAAIEDIAGTVDRNLTFSDYERRLREAVIKIKRRG